MPKIPNWVFFLLAILYFSAVRVDIMDIDASQYAEISREMAVSGERLHIYDKGVNYLDKPPMLFWLSSTSMLLFGATNFAYKLPSILLALLALYATYRLARHFYDEATARVAALILGTTQGMFLMTNDVRCDLALMAWVITGMWLTQEWLNRKKILYLILGSIAFACALMTKGPIGLIAPVLAFGSHWILRREWKNFLKWQYLIAILTIAIFLIPMCIGLYQQYDLHPDKFVNGKNHESGLKFFFWTQSFGRITGENVWNNGADLSFQIVNMLWSFLPWIFLLLPALFIYVRQVVIQKGRLQANEEAISLGGFILCYFAVGLSKYQLPHYIFVAFPFAAILCARFLRDMISYKQFDRTHNVLKTTLIISGALLFVGVILILNIVFPANWLWYCLLIASLSSFFFILKKYKRSPAIIVITGTSAIILINVFLTHYFYYELMKYQAGCVVGKYIQNNRIPANDIWVYRVKDPLTALPYYSQKVIRIERNISYLPLDQNQYVLVEDSGKKELEDRGYQFEVLVQDRYFKVSELTPEFLNSNTRDKATTAYYFCKVIQAGSFFITQE